MINVRKYVRGPTRGYECCEGARVIDAASNEFLDVVVTKIHCWNLPGTLKDMALQKWKDDMEAGNA